MTAKRIGHALDSQMATSIRRRLSFAARRGAGGLNRRTSQGGITGMNTAAATGQPYSPSLA